MKTQPKKFRNAGIEKTLMEITEIACAVLTKHHGRIRSVDMKGAVNLVTNVDREAERRVVAHIRKRYPDHSIMAEESWEGGREVPKGYTWIVDPLDGTTNYAHGLEHYAFTAAVALDGVPVAGVIADPARGHIYRAYQGRGAFLGEKRLRVSEHRRLADSLLVTGFPYDRRKRIPELMALYGAFLKRTHGVRRYGVAALDLALVAAGQFEGYYEQGLYPWDVAAGWLLVTEAGGKVTDYEGKPFHLFSPGILAAAPPIHKSMKKVIGDTTES